MATKHTPGPWRVTEYQPNKRTTRRQSLIWGQQVSPLATVENGPREANANLIAAAPELLEALKLCLPSKCQSLAYSSPNYNGGKDCGKCGYCLGRSAIAKAEGK